jgi:hypothetical protein
MERGRERERKGLKVTGEKGGELLYCSRWEGESKHLMCHRELGNVLKRIII